jgi:hypothetical protein
MNTVVKAIRTGCALSTSASICHFHIVCLAACAKSAQILANLAKALARQTLQQVTARCKCLEPVTVLPICYVAANVATSAQTTCEGPALQWGSGIASCSQVCSWLPAAVIHWACGTVDSLQVCWLGWRKGRTWNALKLSGCLNALVVVWSSPNHGTAVHRTFGTRLVKGGSPCASQKSSILAAPCTGAVVATLLAEAGSPTCGCAPRRILEEARRAVWTSYTRIAEAEAITLHCVGEATSTWPACCASKLVLPDAVSCAATYVAACT